MSNTTSLPAASLAPPEPVAHADGDRSNADGDGSAPWWAAARFAFGVYVLAAVGLIALGLLIVHVVPGSGPRSWDASVSRWFATHRTAAVDRVTGDATHLANTEPVVVIAALVAAVLLWRRHWHQVVFLVAALALEITTFLTVDYVVRRPRPVVPKLDATPSTSSFPSGHAAASIVLWIGIAIIVSVLSAHVVLRVLAWLPASILPPLTAFARVYRGLHYTTDVAAGFLLGAVALLGGWYAAERWQIAHDRRHVARERRETVAA